MTTAADLSDDAFALCKNYRIPGPWERMFMSNAQMVVNIDIEIRVRWLADRIIRLKEHEAHGTVR